MGHALGLALQGRLNDPVSLALIIVRFAPATGSDLPDLPDALLVHPLAPQLHGGSAHAEPLGDDHILLDRKSTRLNSSHGYISYAVFCLKKKSSLTTTLPATRHSRPRLLQLRCVRL